MWILYHVFFTDLKLSIILQTLNYRFESFVINTFPRVISFVNILSLVHDNWAIIVVWWAQNDIVSIEHWRCPTNIAWSILLCSCSMVFQILLILKQLMLVNEFHRFFSATLEVVMISIHWKTLYSITLILIINIIVVILCDRDWRVSSPAKISIQFLKPALQIPFWIRAWVTHGDIVFLTWRSLIG